MTPSPPAPPGKPSLPLAQAGVVALEPLAREHLGLTWAWRNRDDIRCWFHHSAFVPWRDHLAWYERYLAAADDCIYIIADPALDLSPVGQVALYRLDRAAGTAEYGRCMVGDPRARGRGMLEAASRLLMPFSRDRLGIRRWTLTVKPDNAEAIHIYDKLGFREIGREADRLRMQLDF